jgi:hypothetical protein
MEICMKKILLPLTIAFLMVGCLATPVPTQTSDATIAPTSTSTPTAVQSGPCTLTANSAVTAYMRPSAASDQFGVLGAAETIQATVRTADGFYGFDPGVAQAGNAGLFRMRWILKTIQVSTSPGCASLPVVVAPIAGLCYAMIMSDTAIHASPDVNSPVLVTMHLDDYAMVTGSTPGWVTLDLNVGTASLDQAGYLRQSDLGGFNGPCDGF